MGTYVIAEAGVNHNGNIDNAKRLIEVAKAAGANAVKFQTFIPKNLVTKQAIKADYQLKNTNNDESQFYMLQKLTLSFEEFRELKYYSDHTGIEFLSSPFDFETIDFLDSIGMKRFKIPSGEITNLPYLIKIAKKGKPVILSTGMSSIEETEFAVQVLEKNGAPDITILHCNTQYPTPYTDANILAITTLKNALHCKVGYSDHTLGIEVPIAAVALGAEVIEKHFTLDKSLNGPDHLASLEPNELKAMIDSIRNVEKALGSGVKEPSLSEFDNIKIVRKSIVAKKHIKKGELFTEENLAVKRPGNGMSPLKWFDVIGNKAKKDYFEDDLIEL
ncbi:MAG: N-acetylneuraminate synthase [Peptococcaceae bacterium]|nr:N-acetylneuraminate synthase [Peptococcaceae bacterium]